MAWSSKAFPDELLPPEVRKHLSALTHKVRRSRALLIRQSSAKREKLHCFALHSGEKKSGGVTVALSDYDDMLAWDGHSGHTVTEPLYLVCTHGKHDQCCAKFGFATYCALRAHAGAAVWECSHVGGDRFAANVLCLPEGLYYGHVRPEDAPELLGAHRRGEVSLKHYRGRSCYSRTAQIGEYFVRTEGGVLGLDLMLIDTCSMEPDYWRARFLSHGSARQYEVEFRAFDTGLRELLTCRAEAPQPVRKYELCAYRTSELTQ